MTNQPSNRSAALAGIWTGAGVTLFVGWSASGPWSSSFAENAAWLGVAAVFIFLPAVYFVVGPGAAKFSRDWVNNPVERALYLALLTRLAVWIATAGVVGGLLLTAQKNLG